MKLKVLIRHEAAIDDFKNATKSPKHKTTLNKIMSEL